MPILNLEKVLEQLRPGNTVSVPIEIRIDVPGCTCSSRTQEQLDRADVCVACVSYFDLGGTD